MVDLIGLGGGLLERFVFVFGICFEYYHVLRDCVVGMLYLFSKWRCI